ncbi:hypothetical protein DPMN_031570 [Dreissena polymorpha]|uniref:Uncharacterized protein n=1 Tax=Dreissena polymorpha TaxID=45954 RepID=A0A9D4RI59_DREPO|nr:hypothetical protein DPMN_031570 [Dreissena polymorpha]
MFICLPFYHHAVVIALSFNVVLKDNAPSLQSSPEIPCFDDWASTTSTQTGCSELYGGLSLRPLPEDAYACYRKASTTSVRDFVVGSICA